MDRDRAFEIMMAIIILDPNTSAEFLSSLEEFNGLTGDDAKLAAVNYACEMACSALAVVLRDYYYEETFLS